MDKETFEKVAKISEDMKSLWLVIKKNTEQCHFIVC